MPHRSDFNEMASGDNSQHLELLTGWKAIAGHLGVDKSTAQRWVKSRGLPVRSLPGLRGKPAASVAELDAWLKSGSSLVTPPAANPPAGAAATTRSEEATEPDARRPFEQHPLRGTRRKWLHFALFGAGAVFGSVLLSFSGVMNRDRRRPAASRIEGATLVVLADDGSTLWRHTFPFELDNEIYKRLERVCLFADLDDDGELETLVPYFPLNRPAERSLMCFDSKGRRRWEFLPGKVVTDNLGRQFAPPYWCNAFEVLRGRDAGPARLVVSSNHHVSFADQVAVLDGETGRVLSEYWHRGHLYAMEIADIDGDGEAEVMAGGVNDAPEYQQATLLVFGNRRISGANRNPRGGLYFQGMEPGSERLEVFFPRTPISQAQEFNFVLTVRATQYAITVIVAEGIRRDAPTIAYEFNRSFEPTGVMLSNQIEERYTFLQNAGDAPREPFEAIAERLKSQVKVVRYPVRNSS